MSRLIYLGCSLSALTDKPKFLANSLGRDLVDLSISASSNQLQSRRIKSYIVNNTLSPDDIIVWQLTGSARGYLRLPLHGYNLQKKTETPTFFLSDPNIFDGAHRVDLLCHSDELLKYNELLHDVNDSLEEVLATILMLKKCCNKIFVYFGFDGSIDAAEKEIFIGKLDQHRVSRLANGSYLSWIKRKNLPMEEDGFHPANESAILFAEKILLTELNKL